jgi:hypothetical protein
LHEGEDEMTRIAPIALSLCVTAAALAATGVLAQAPVSQPAPATAPRPARQIVATYFHGDVRCATCKKLEADARAAVEQAFAAELADGRVVFKAVNVDRPENAHFNEDYKLVTRSLVVTEEVDGKVVRFSNLDKIWQLVRDEVAYRDYVVGAVRSYLDGKA